MKPGILIAALVLAGGCHGQISDARQMEALNGCTHRWRAEFPDLYGDANEAARRRALAAMMPEQIAFDEGGVFSFEQPPSEVRENYDMQFVCRGNIERRTIELVSHGSTVRRPGPGTVWSF
ncbi:MAG TPA: hypothetical protein VLK25_04450 [Allosphingosinicella sp.]|nr:hypothetical protein [Allosphingosinicella sp.]